MSYAGEQFGAGAGQEAGQPDPPPGAQSAVMQYGEPPAAQSGSDQTQFFQTVTFYDDPTGNIQISGKITCDKAAFVDGVTRRIESMSLVINKKIFN